MREGAEVIMTRKRAQEIWAARSRYENALAMTKEEDAYVKRVWDTIPDGRSTFMTAFHLIRNGKDPLAGKE